MSQTLLRFWVNFESFKHLLNDEDLQEICIKRKLLEKQQIEYKQCIKIEVKTKRDKEKFEYRWERLEKERQEEVERLNRERIEFEHLKLLHLKRRNKI